MYLNPENDTIRKRQGLEVAIVKQIVKDALKVGYKLSVDDGGDEYAITNSTSQKDVLAALMNTDEDVLILTRFKVQDVDAEVEAERGWVRLVYGNSGWDVMNDWTTNLDDVLAGAIALAEKLEERS